MILLYQTHSKALALFLSFFMKMESFDSASSSRILFQKVGTVDLIKGKNHLLRMNISRGEVGFVSYPSELAFKTAGFNKFKIGTYVITSAIIAGAIIGSTIYSVEVAMRE